MNGFLTWIERTGNKLPDPVFIFLYLTIVLIVVSAIVHMLGLSAAHPTKLDEAGQPVLIYAASLLSADNIQRLWVEMPKTFTHFHPLGYVLVVMLGAGVAERCGLFAAAMSAAVRSAPRSLLTPVVALVAMVGNHAADAGYVVLIPLAGVLFAAAGRHPLAGIAAAFAGVSGGFSANISPGQLDALLFGITEEAVMASALDPTWNSNIAGNAYFIAALLFIYLPVIWFVTDKIIEPRLGKWVPDSGSDMASYGDEDKPLTDDQRRTPAEPGLPHRRLRDHAGHRDPPLQRAARAGPPQRATLLSLHLAASAAPPRQAPLMRAPASARDEPPPAVMSRGLKLA